MSDDNLVPFRRRDNLDRFANSPLVDRRYGAADPQRLSAFEERYGIRFSDAYRRFLLRENGLDYTLSPRAVSGLPDEERQDAMVLCDINTLFGIGNGHAYFDLEVIATEMGFHDYRLTPFAHVVGLGGDFSTLVEIGAGSYAGSIIYTDGELFRGMPQDILAGKSVDEAVEYFTEIGYYSPIATDFDDLIAKYSRLS